jgi:plastocyanin
MRIAVPRVVSTCALALSVACIASCDAVGISKPISSDGSCASAAAGCQQNKGAQSLSLTADHTILKVGEGVSITARFGGMTLNGSGNFLPATVSDSSVISASAFGAYGLSVGTASLTASYEGSPATLAFSVVPNADGVSAIVQLLVYAGGTTAWLPAVVKARPGWTVQFNSTDNTLHKHNVVFDPLPGAPADVALGASSFRMFPVAGSFTYSCTVHGETGVVNVVAP